MSDYEFELPCYITHGKKTYPINLNWYRNAHHQVSNAVKKKFSSIIKPQFDGLPKIEGKVHIKLVYYASRNNSPDLDNFTSVAKKFFQDSMVEFGLIDDDNVNCIVSTSEYYGGIDRDNSRVSVYITMIE